MIRILERHCHERDRLEGDEGSPLSAGTGNKDAEESRVGDAFFKDIASKGLGHAGGKEASREEIITWREGQIVVEKIIPDVFRNSQAVTLITKGSLPRKAYLWGISSALGVVKIHVAER